MQEVYAVVRIAIVRARTRAKAEGGRQSQARRIGLARMVEEDVVLAKLRKNRAIKEASKLLACLRDLMPSCPSDRGATFEPRW